jgi:hypothetical protein
MAHFVADDDRALLSERRDQRQRVARERLGIGTAIGNSRRVVAAQERAHRAVALGGEARAHEVPGMRSVGEAVKQQHQGAGALLENGEAEPVGFDECFGHARSSYDAGAMAGARAFPRATRRLLRGIYFSMLRSSFW